MADIRLAKPAAGTTQTVPSAPDGRFIFDFPADAATLTRSGDNLVLTFEDGASIQLQDFYTTYSKEEMPSFQVEGVEISGQDFFAALGEDLMPAAGPAAGSSASRSGRYNEYGGSDLLDGLDHLGRLDIGFDGGVQLATDTVEPSPYYEDDHGVTVTPSAPDTDPDDPDIPVQGEDFPPTMPHDVLQVDESALDGGSGGGSATADGSMSVSAPDGVATITIGGVVVWQNGVLTGNPVQTDEGHLDVTGFDGTNLTYTYTLDKATQEHGKEGGGENDAIAHEMEVVVTDSDGDSGSAVIRVEITDDVPTIESFGHDVTEGDSNAITGDALTGAAAGADGADFAWTNPAQQGQYGTITLNPDGTYTYTLDNDNAVVKALSKDETLTEEFTYTYTDADGDIAEGKVTITINGKDNGIVIEPTDPAAGSDTVTVYESGLADGSQAGQDDAPTTASGSLVITAPDGVASIVIGGIVVFEKGGLTGNTVSTDEGTLVVTGFDPVTGELKFTYELSGNTTEHSGSGMDDISHDLTVTVTDMDGTEVDSTITVNVTDDVPSISADSLSKDVASGAEVTGRVDIDYGADNEGGQKSLTVNGQKGTAAEDGKLSFDLDNGTLVFDPATGGYEFTAKANVTTDQTLEFVVTDADGDTDEVTVTVNISKPEAPSFTGTISVDEEGLADGTNPDATSETATWTAPDGYTIVSVSDGKLGTVVKTGDTTLDYTLSDAITHPAGSGENTATGADGFEVTIMDGDGNTYTVKVDVDVTDDVPMLTVGKPVTDMKPGDSGDNLVKVDEEISFINYKQTGIGENGKPVYEQTTGELSTTYWNDQITISAAKVTYDGVDEWGNKRISTEDPAGMSLDYSFYNGGGKQYYKGTPPQEDREKGIAIWDGKGWYREAPESDWGLTVNGGEGQGEIQASGNTSEAVVINLKGYAYGMTIDFGAFFAGKSSDEDPAAGTGYDNVSEKALITFYKDGKLVYSTVVYGTDSGEFTFNTGDVVLEGFNKVVVSAVDNSTDKYKNESSDFTIQGFDFITKRNDPIIINKGTVTAESGADGFADAYADSHVQFDLAGMVNEDSLSEDGTSGTVTVLVDGIEQTVKLELSEGSSGESILTGTLQESGEDGKPVDGEQLFTATLDKNGNWTMEQYEQFRVPGDGQESNQFDLVFKTEDADGDMAEATVNVPLEVVDHTPGLDTSIEIGNGDDTIVIKGGEGVAGTVAAGDAGGVTEGQQVETSYNVCFILDMSTSMTNNRIGGQGSDRWLNRLEAAEQSIQNFITSIEGNTDFTDGSVTVAVIPFAEDAANPIEITITKKAGATTYSYEGISYASFEAFSRSFVNDINRADVDSTSITDYGPAFSKAAAWFDALGDSVENATGNITYFLTDGRPAGYNTDDAYKDDYQRAWEGYQELLSAQGDGHINIHAIGFGNDLSDTDMENLAMFDNTAQSVGDAHAANGWFEASDGVYAPGITYEHPETIDRNATYYVQIQGGLQEVTYSHGSWGYSSGWPFYSWTSVDEGSLLEQVIVSVNGGTSQQVTDTGSLTAAFENGFRPGTLVAAGDDTITAENSDSSVIIYGDVMNTDRLLHELNQNKAISDMVAASLLAVLPGYGSGSEVFQWLEDNGDKLTGTKFEGWTHADTVDYMLRHAEELGYETRVDNDGGFYLVTADGTVLNMDGTEANGIALDDLTGRGGGDDVITGSSASDTIYGQEGDDLLVGDAPSGSGEGSTVGSIEDTTVDSIKKMSIDDLDAFIQSVEGTDADGDDRLFGGTGDDVLLGMGGDDYIDGGAGEDAIFGGRGNDIIVYDSNDYLVSGGSGIDFMVSDNSTLTLTTLLSGGKDGHEGPIVDSIEVLLKGDAALSLTSIQELADKYGITLGTNDAGQETLTLDMSKWTAQQDGSYDFKGDADLTLETNLQQDSGASSDSDGEMAQQVFILQNSNS
ncbi:VCBS domain-containing protein [Desulfovibrio piger]|uniref:VCBS domain-containing protein n=1 Tax=Desulfovibrio piger TaxID=901 RepID=UPI0032C0D90C